MRDLKKNGVKILVDDEVTEKEIDEVLAESLAEFKDQGKKLLMLEIFVDGDELCVNRRQRSPIKRIRRITGYLSEFDNFNDAKRAEAGQRVIHAGTQSLRDW